VYAYSGTLIDGEAGAACAPALPRSMEGHDMSGLLLTEAPPRNLARSALAVIAGFVAIFVTSLGTDQVLHSLGVYPPWGEPMRQTSLNLLALSYRLVYDTLGCALTAWLAPRNPMRHALTLGLIGLVLSSLGAVGGIMQDLGPAWYPILLALSSLPTAWLGGWLVTRPLR
jgi:hypothetical protein